MVVLVVVIVLVEELVVSESTGRDVEVDDTVAVQSSHALPLSEGQLKLVGLWPGVVVVVVAPATYGEVVLELPEGVVQSSQALPLSEGQVWL